MSLQLIQEPRSQEWWDRYFIGLAEYLSRPSKDPSTKTGAVIIRPDRSIVSTGYNGLAKGVKDLAERYNNRELKYRLILHCEENCIYFSNEDLTGYTLYTWPFMSCIKCANVVIQNKITRCVAPYNTNERWVKEFELTRQLFKEANVELVELD